MVQFAPVGSRRVLTGAHWAPCGLGKLAAGTEPPAAPSAAPPAGTSVRPSEQGPTPEMATPSSPGAAAWSQACSVLSLLPAAGGVVPSNPWGTRAEHPPTAIQAQCCPSPCFTCDPFCPLSPEPPRGRQASRAGAGAPGLGTWGSVCTWGRALRPSDAVLSRMTPEALGSACAEGCQLRASPGTSQPQR